MLLLKISIIVAAVSVCTCTPHTSAPHTQSNGQETGRRTSRQEGLSEDRNLGRQELQQTDIGHTCPKQTHEKIDGHEVSTDERHILKESNNRQVLQQTDKEQQQTDGQTETETNRQGTLVGSRQTLKDSDFSRQILRQTDDTRYQSQSRHTDKQTPKDRYTSREADKHSKRETDRLPKNKQTDIGILKDRYTSRQTSRQPQSRQSGRLINKNRHTGRETDRYTDIQPQNRPADRDIIKDRHENRGTDRQNKVAERANAKERQISRQTNNQTGRKQSYGQRRRGGRQRVWEERQNGEKAERQEAISLLQWTPCPHHPPRPRHPSPNAEVRPQTQSYPDTPQTVQLDSETHPEAQFNLDNTTESQFTRKTRPKANFSTEARPRTNSNSEIYSETQSDSESGPIFRSNSKTLPEAHSSPETYPKAQVNSETGIKIESNPDYIPKAHLDPITKSRISPRESVPETTTLKLLSHQSFFSSVTPAPSARHCNISTSLNSTVSLRSTFLRPSPDALAKLSSANTPQLASVNLSGSLTGPRSSTSVKLPTLTLQRSVPSGSKRTQLTASASFTSDFASRKTQLTSPSSQVTSPKPPTTFIKLQTPSPKPHVSPGSSPPSVKASSPSFSTGPLSLQRLRQLFTQFQKRTRKEQVPEILRTPEKNKKTTSLPSRRPVFRSFGITRANVSPVDTRVVHPFSHNGTYISISSSAPASTLPPSTNLPLLFPALSTNVDLSHAKDSVQVTTRRPFLPQALSTPSTSTTSSLLTVTIKPTTTSQTTTALLTTRLQPKSTTTTTWATIPVLPQPSKVTFDTAPTILPKSPTNIPTTIQPPTSIPTTNQPPSTMIGITKAEPKPPGHSVNIPTPDNPMLQGSPLSPYGIAFLKKYNLLGFGESESQPDHSKGPIETLPTPKGQNSGLVSLYGPHSFGLGNFGLSLQTQSIPFVQDGSSSGIGYFGLFPGLGTGQRSAQQEQLGNPLGLFGLRDLGALSNIGSLSPLSGLGDSSVLGDGLGDLANTGVGLRSLANPTDGLGSLTGHGDSLNSPSNGFSGLSLSASGLGITDAQSGLNIFGGGPLSGLHVGSSLGGNSDRLGRGSGLNIGSGVSGGDLMGNFGSRGLSTIGKSGSDSKPSVSSSGETEKQL